MRLFLVWLVNAVSLLLVAYLMPAISINSFTTALIVALVLGLINTVIRPLLVLLTLPVTLLTLGLFIFVINGLLFWWVGELIDGFTVQGFWAGVWGALVYSVISWGLAALFLRKKAEGVVKINPIGAGIAVSPAPTCGLLAARSGPSLLLCLKHNRTPTR